MRCQSKRPVTVTYAEAVFKSEPVLSLPSVCCPLGIIGDNLPSGSIRMSSSGLLKRYELTELRARSSPSQRVDVMIGSNI